ncbi:MAG TPA: PilZ domain-containing protein [Nitrospiraceae bacterium]|nr:PilZ domain-containing protein [Nitrospiraceae bacterium]
MDLARLFLPKQGFPVKVIDPRRCTRRVVTIPTTVEDKSGPTNGVVTNLSKTGCRLQLVTPCFRSHHLTLKLYQHDETPALQITRAEIRWIKREGAGVEFVNLSQEDKTKLQRLCSE